MTITVVRHSRWLLFLLVLLLLSCKHRSTAEFITIKDPIVALTHVRVIDGTGSAAKDDQTIIIESGRITSVGPTSTTAVPASARTLELNGQTAMPGLVGMHDHLFYSTDRGERDVLAGESFAPLYLASGVTTIRTAGTLKLSSDREIKRAVDAGEFAGPKIHLSSPYINHRQGESLDPARTSQLINEWADQGVTSLKVYENVSRSELAMCSTLHAREVLRLQGISAL